MSTKKFPISSFFFDEDEFSPKPHATGLSVYEEGDYVVIETALPGLSTEDIEVTHAHGYILIQGEKKEEETKRKYYKKAMSSFTYRVPLPPGVDLSTDPDAVFKDGVMKVTFRKGRHKGKSIPVKEGK